MIVNTLLLLFGAVLGVGGTLLYFRGRRWYTERQNARNMIDRWKSNLGTVVPAKPVGRFADENRIVTRGQDKAFNKGS